MSIFYSDEKNVQMVIALMKAHGIKKVVASPGGTNVSFVASIQNDSDFEVYSSIDERSAAYIACGLAEESGEPVVLSCTGATASRNYMPGLTEAFYRKLPILVITSSQPNGRIGHNVPQVTDRTVMLNDIYRVSVQIPIINSAEDEWSSQVMMNNAMLELRRDGGGPAHINLMTTYSANFDVKTLPDVKVIKRVQLWENMPAIDKKKVAIFVGAHSKWSDELTAAVDEFCEKYNAVVLCDHTSNYHGKYRVLASLILKQESVESPLSRIDLLIHLGNISGAYFRMYPKEVWRVDIDGEIRDTFKKLTYVFEMRELDFFRKYNDMTSTCIENTNIVEWNEKYNELCASISDMPFSNVWIAKNTIGRLPEGSVLHLGILNSLRSWNFFEAPDSVLGYCNTGGFGIDGIVSSLIGAALVNPDRLYFGVVGDLGFFYDINSLGNRHISNNVRLIIVNNGIGTEFKHYNAIGGRIGNEVDSYIAAAGHYGNKSRNLVKHYAEDLGFEYLSATNKDEYISVVEKFINPAMGDKSIILEVFTTAEDESAALRVVENIDTSATSVAKDMVKGMLGTKGINVVRKIIGK